MAYSITPPSSSYLGSSPFSCRQSQSLKRVTSRGSSNGQAQRLSISQGLSNDIDKFEDPLIRYSLSTSGGSRGASKNFVHSFQVAEGLPKPISRTVGFELEKACDQPPSPHALHSIARKGSGLLSKAFLPSPEVLSKPWPGVNASFPEVDMEPLRQLQNRSEIFKSDVVEMAFKLAATAHGSQQKHGESVLHHCLETAKILAGLGLDSDTVAAGLLHEVFRSNESWRPRLDEFLPSSVAGLVTQVSTISEISRLYRRNQNSLGDENVRRMLLAMEDTKAMLIKLADRVHTMQLIVAAGPTTETDEAFSRYELAKETLEIYSVVANRLGIWCLKAELEDLSFAVLHPKEYEMVKALVKDRQNPEGLSQTINNIKSDLDQVGIKYEDISGRPKNLFGIWKKMRENGTQSIEKVYDVNAIRVIVANKHDCYVVQRVLQKRYQMVSGRSKDFIKDIKKPNGYQSLHETVYGEDGKPVEIQIRTSKMHYIAEYGFAAHWKYKEKLDSEDEWLEKEVQYKKWLTTYKLNLHDKKVRPAGAGPSDNALKSLGLHLLDKDQNEQQKVDPFLKHDRFRLSPPARQNVSIVLQTGDSIEFKQLPTGITVANASDLLGIRHLGSYSLVVNGKNVPSSVVLQSCDLLTVVPTRLGTSAPSARSGLDVYIPGMSKPLGLKMGSNEKFAGLCI